MADFDLENRDLLAVVAVAQQSSLLGNKGTRAVERVPTPIMRIEDAGAGSFKLAPAWKGWTRITRSRSSLGIEAQ